MTTVRTGSGAAGHLATATVRRLVPDGRTPHEGTGGLEAGDLARSVWGGTAV
ncbi:hypothetical protein ACG2OD_35185 [Streptomyces sp. PDY-4]|uniref:hypothetical protein n=1 Tax=Streptomyces TaxID=1883 RepID=UPI0013CEBCB7|nr:hypothetical protein [Streptomyces fungicidicus]